MAAKKPATKKPCLKKTAKTTKKTELDKKPPVPKHPLMLDSKSWDKQKVMDILCMRIASSSSSIVTLLAEGYEGNSLPTYTAVKEWLAADGELSAQYARAKEDQSEYMAEEMLDIADNGENDYMEKYGADGQSAYVLNGEHVQRSKLRIEARKWLMGKLKPKKYGDKIDLNHSGNIGIESLIAGAGDDTSRD